MSSITHPVVPEFRNNIRQPHARVHAAENLYGQPSRSTAALGEPAATSLGGMHNAAQPVGWFSCRIADDVELVTHTDRWPVN
jgi:hypothetical protein